MHGLVSLRTEKPTFSFERRVLLLLSLSPRTLHARYADVVVHRLLAAAIGAGPLPSQLAHKGGLHDLAENMNRRHRAAQLAGRASVQLHTQLYFKDHPAANEKVREGGGCI
jgi:hypothetical protein